MKQVSLNEGCLVRSLFHKEFFQLCLSGQGIEDSLTVKFCICLVTASSPVISREKVFTILGHKIVCCEYVASEKSE